MKEKRFRTSYMVVLDLEERGKREGREREGEGRRGKGKGWVRIRGTHSLSA